MKIKNLNKRPAIEKNKKILRRYIQFAELLNELKSKSLTKEVIHAINAELTAMNAMDDSDSGKELGKQVRKTQSKILRLIEKELKLVPKSHYRNMWLAVGMSAFGIPLGVMFGVVFENMAFIGIGMPIGMAIGITVGASLDKKAAANGKQLDLELH